MQVGDVNGVAGGARHVGNDGALVPEDGVDQGGFARVGASNDGHLDGGGGVLPFFRFFLQFFFQRGALLFEEVVQPGGEFGEAPAVGGGEKDVVVKAQSGEFSQVQILLFMVRLVEQEDDGNVRFTEVVRNALVNGSEVVPAVQHEEDEVRRFHGYVRLCRHLFRKAVAQARADAARIHDFTGAVRNLAGGGEPVASDAGFIMHDGDAPSGHSVEDGGFPDIGPAYDGDGGDVLHARHVTRRAGAVKANSAPTAGASAGGLSLVPGLIVKVQRHGNRDDVGKP